ncbi:hypothetical protein DFJ68_3567 [Terracoccus luteus]|uniref:Uncharacterized protein n=1 Tax=Terracoccus luteus TaxID=53356 RepID=A0A495Y4U7_9MICO|nr:hypothetical protein [Terracoccus luteus]RKT80088.1 hypothetical protein DFJ68_3567 [Terracoccus luteus]
MSHETDEQGPTAARELPTFDPGAPAPTIAPTTTYTYAVTPTVTHAAGPPDAATGPRWSARKTAVTAGLALVLTSAGAIGAAAALPSGSTTRDAGGFGGGRGTFQPGTGLGQRGQQGTQQNGAQQFGGQGSLQFGGQGSQQFGGQGGRQDGSQLPDLQNGLPGQDPAQSGSGAQTT